MYRDPGLEQFANDTASFAGNVNRQAPVSAIAAGCHLGQAGPAEYGDAALFPGPARTPREVTPSVNHAKRRPE